MKIYRLLRFEVLNWGTFNARIWRIEPNGMNILMTGDNGAGKSTLIDGLATLLVNPKRMHYNLAGGANSKERSKLSYVLGHYKSETAGETSGAPGRSKPVALRNGSQQSVILAVFSSGDDQVTLAQAFWCSDLTTVNQLFLVADGAQAIEGLFTPFVEPAQLRKRLKDLPGAEVFDTFVRYGESFRRRLGIDNEQAMDLFAKTMAMKDVENLTAFVRGSMLDPATIDEQINELLSLFESLQESHRKVVEAREQISFLSPIMAKCSEYRRHISEAADGERDQLALPAWIANQEIVLLERRIHGLTTDLSSKKEQIESKRTTVEQLRNNEVALRSEIATSGGGRIAKLEEEIVTLTAELKRRTELRNRYQQWATGIGLMAPDTVDLFHAQQSDVRQQLDTMSRTLDELTNEQSDIKATFRQVDEEDKRIGEEIDSLKTRTNRIDRDRIRVRQQLSEALQIPVGRLPFAGELMQVKRSETDWEVAIEKALHGFANTLLVPVDVHDGVAGWINTNHLGLRLHINRFQERVFGFASDRPDSLVSKVDVKPGPAHDWLHGELVRRFNYRCCESVDEAKRARPGITRTGYIAHDEDRSEKDDRRQINDRRWFLLGWSNTDLIDGLEEDRRTIDGKRRALAGRLSTLRDKLAQHGNNRVALSKLADIASFAGLDTSSTASAINVRQSEINELNASSNVLSDLNRRLGEVRHEIEESDRSLSEMHTQHARLENSLALTNDQLSAATERATTADADARGCVWPRLTTLAEEIAPGRSGSLTGLKEVSERLHRAIAHCITAANNAIKPLVPQITRSMTDFNNRWPHLVHDIDPSPDAAAEYERLLRQLLDDDLPSYEERFRTALQENTFNGIAHFNATLYSQRDTVHERLELINKSLRPITFRPNPDTYIQLVHNDTFDTDIRIFRDRLRTCTQGLAGNAGQATIAENETKFTEISELIAQLRGRPGVTEPDARWRKKVTDVRNWFEFGASERLRTDDREIEHYSDSNGKSGGQKENLAYTMLAAGLAYQYRVHDTDRKKGFRFVIIDEAFGRASDKITDFGLRLFRSLDLQMLVATPMQKIHPIEPHVSSVAFIHIVDRKDSRIRNMTLQEMHKDRSVHEAMKRAQQPSE